MSERPTPDLTTRSLVPIPPVIDHAEVAELAEAGKDLRQMARDIAAGDASPTTLRRRLARNRKKPGDPASDPDGATS